MSLRTTSASTSSACRGSGSSAGVRPRPGLGAGSERGDQRGGVEGAFDADAVGEEGRGPGHARAKAAVDVTLHACGVDAAGELVGNELGVESELVCGRDEVGARRAGRRCDRDGRASARKRPVRPRLLRPAPQARRRDGRRAGGSAESRSAARLRGDRAPVRPCPAPRRRTGIGNRRTSRAPAGHPPGR